MIADLRKTIRKKDFSILLGLDEQHGFCVKNPLVVETQKAYAKKDKHSIFTSMKGLQKADSTHLTPAALEKHGERLYEAFKKLNK